MSSHPPASFVAALQAHRSGRLGEAEQGYRTTLQAHPASRAVYQNLAALLRAQRRWAEAEDLYRAAVRHCDPSREFAFHLGLSRLAGGDYAEGFELFEARRALPSMAPVPRPSFPEWDGSAVSSLLLLPEQGFGDEILFARYVPRLRARDIRVTLTCSKSLTRLFEPLGADLLAAEGEVSFGRHEAWALVGSLPRLLKTRIDSVPPPAPLGMVRARGGGIGIVARGNPRLANDANRSLSPEAASQLAALPGAVDLAPEKTGARDFRDTAELIAGLDLVVTVDTSVANLAASMGAPTWVMLPAIGADWRWTRSGDRSPWYPGARLFRQGAAGDWDTVLAQIRAAIPTA